MKKIKYLGVVAASTLVFSSIATFMAKTAKAPAIKKSSIV